MWWCLRAYFASRSKRSYCSVGRVFVHAWQHCSCACSLLVPRNLHNMGLNFAWVVVCLPLKNTTLKLFRYIIAIDICVLTLLWCFCTLTLRISLRLLVTRRISIAICWLLWYIQVLMSQGLLTLSSRLRTVVRVGTIMRSRVDNNQLEKWGPPTHLIPSFSFFFRFLWNEFTLRALVRRYCVRGRGASRFILRQSFAGRFYRFGAV